MLTREEIAEIVQYCKEHGVSYKSRLKEIGIPEWRFYESKRRYAEVQASERESGEFLQLVRGNDSFPKPVHYCYQKLSTPDYRNLCTSRYRLHGDAPQVCFSWAVGLDVGAGDTVAGGFCHRVCRSIEF